MSDSLRPYESQHARPPCPSPTPGVHSDSCPSSWWCHPAISSSVVPSSSCPQSLPASGSFPMSQLFTWGGQSTGVSALASVLPMNIQDWFPLRLTGWISLQSKGLSRLSDALKKETQRQHVQESEPWSHFKKFKEIISDREKTKVSSSSKVQFSCSVALLWPTLCKPHGLKHASLACPSPTPGACSNSCPLSQWCHPTIWSSVIPFASCLQSFLASGSKLTKCKANFKKFWEHEWESLGRYSWSGRLFSDFSLET